MMRVLIVSAYYPEHGGGVEMIASQLAHRYAIRGAAVTWAASDESSVAPGRLPMHACNLAERRFGFPYPVWGPLSLVWLASAISAADIVHVHDCLYQGCVFAFLCAKAAGKPVLLTQHIGLVPYRSALPRRLMSAANRVLGRLLLGGCDSCVFYSRSAQAYFARFARPNRPMFIPNGVDTHLFRPVEPEARREVRRKFGWSTDNPVCLFVGRFVEKKGLHLIRQMVGRFRCCDWVFVGRGRENPGLWGEPNVRAVGFVPHEQLPAYYQAADLVVLPSTGEGFPLVVQESLACGTPVVISTETAEAMPGIEAVAHTCMPTVESLASLLTSLLSEFTKLEASRSACADFARKHWNWERCTDQYWELCNRLVQRNNRYYSEVVP